MKIYIVTCESFPNGMAETARILNMARALRHAGAECKVVVAKRTEIAGRPVLNAEADGLIHGVPFHYVPGNTLRSSNLILRQCRDKWDVFATSRFLIRELSEGDALIACIDGYPFLASILLKCCKARGIRFVTELCEYPYESGNRRVPKLEKRFVLRHLFPRYDAVIAISDTLAEFARGHCDKNCHVGKVPILVDFEAFRLDDRSADETVPYIFHCGTLFDKKDGFSDMLEAFGQAVSQSGLQARFISSGSVSEAQNPDKVKEIIARYGIENRVEFVGYVAGERKAKLLSGASLVIINKPDNLQNRCGFSTKLGEYLAAGKPVIHTRVGEALNYLEDGVNACLVDCGDVVALRDAMIKLLSDRDLAARIGDAGRQLCRDRFDFKANATPLFDICKSRV